MLAILALASPAATLVRTKVSLAIKKAAPGKTDARVTQRLTPIDGAPDVADLCTGNVLR